MINQDLELRIRRLPELREEGARPRLLVVSAAARRHPTARAPQTLTASTACFPSSLWSPEPCVCRLRLPLREALSDDGDQGFVLRLDWSWQA